MASSPPPLPPSPSLDDLLIPPLPPTVSNICGDDDSSIDIFPPIISDAPAQSLYVPPPPKFYNFCQDECYRDIRGRSRSRSRSRSPSSRGRSASPDRQLPIPVPIPPPSLYYTTPSVRSRSSSPDSSCSPIPRRPRRKCYSYRSRTPSPLRPYSYTPPGPPQIIYPPPPPPIMSVPSMTPPPMPMWSSIPIAEPVDILTFHYNKNMAYAPAAKTYDEAIDNVLELWPDLREFDRDRIHLFVGGADQIVRVPKMAWQLVMCDLPRYEIIHIQVDQPPPPPQYQSDGKVNWTSGDEKKDKDKKQTRSRGFFSSIKRVFWR